MPLPRMHLCNLKLVPVALLTIIFGLPASRTSDTCDLKDGIKDVQSPNRSGTVCVVVRTYWGHGKHSETGLKQLLQSLRRQTYDELRVYTQLGLRTEARQAS